MNEYTFSDGTIMTSKLPADEFIKRLRRLDTLRVLTEDCECPEGRSICEKARRAYNKMTDFTGIIRLTFSEKEWLGYMLESNNRTSEDIQVIKFYCKI